VKVLPKNTKNSKKCAVSHRFFVAESGVFAEFRNTFTASKAIGLRIEKTVINL
jgi:hypothetical protein